MLTRWEKKFYMKKTTFPASKMELSLPTSNNSSLHRIHSACECYGLAESPKTSQESTSNPMSENCLQKEQEQKSTFDLLRSLFEGSWRGPSSIWDSSCISVRKGVLIGDVREKGLF